MKIKFSILLMCLMIFANAQTVDKNVNRFFYKHTFKPKKDSATLDSAIAILDINEKKSIYKDYTFSLVKEDTILQSELKKIERTKEFPDFAKIIKKPKFTYEIVKIYPQMKQQFIDDISMEGQYGYESNLKFKWDILPENEVIGEYKVQKATTEFGGRKWVAWFSKDIPFQDGPYKFCGLPGLIVKIEDSEKNYSWTLMGNKKVEDEWRKQSPVKIVTKERFNKAQNEFKANPLKEQMAEIQQVPSELLNTMKMPGSNSTIGEYLKKQENFVKEIYNRIDNPIEKQ